MPYVHALYMQTQLPPVPISSPSLFCRPPPRIPPFDPLLLPEPLSTASAPVRSDGGDIGDHGGEANDQEQPSMRFLDDCVICEKEGHCGRDSGGGGASASDSAAAHVEGEGHSNGREDGGPAGVGGGERREKTEEIRQQG